MCCSDGGVFTYLGDYLRAIDDVGSPTFPLQGAGSLSVSCLAIAWEGGLGLFFREYFCVVRFDYSFYTVHTTVADFYIVFVKNFV